MSNTTNFLKLLGRAEWTSDNLPQADCMEYGSRLLKLSGLVSLLDVVFTS